MNELYHHGVKGQKWGIRRYQNPDGTLTEEGRRRFGSVKKLQKVHNRENKIFTREVTGVNTYNEAVRRNQANLDTINKKYYGKDLGYDHTTNRYKSKEGRKYLKEIEAAWKKTYSQTVKDVANKYETIGEDYVKNLDVTHLPLYSVGSVAAFIEDDKK